jgi:hypothetical protein
MPVKDEESGTINIQEHNRLTSVVIPRIFKENLNEANRRIIIYPIPKQQELNRKLPLRILLKVSINKLYLDNNEKQRVQQLNVNNRPSITRNQPPSKHSKHS